MAKTVPLAQSLAANEQIVADKVPAHTANTKSIKVLFATNDAHISTSEARRLRVFLDSVPAGASLSITGYADGTGKHAANLRLADRRANAVRDFVTAGKAPWRVSISHATKCCPDSPDATADERAKSRDVEVTVIQ
jgi:outer membrane protein OmpA-like peptidoglycan-associated protein